MRVAVVGSGISGLTATWLLRKRHEVTLFEAGERFGGHTHTRMLALPEGPEPVDTGFIVYNDRNYPTLERLFSALSIEGRPTGMSFSLSDERSGLEYAGHSVAGLFAQKRRLLSPTFWGMLRDILRFNRAAPALLATPGEGPMLGAFLAEGGYGEAFAEHYLLPMGAAIWSVPTKGLRAFPAKRIIEFFENHGLLSLKNRPQWYVVEGGSSAYLAPILATLPPSRQRLATPVRGLRRGEAGVRVRSDAGEELFDAIVLACHSDEALALLDDASPEERAVLGALRYQKNDVVLHCDEALLPRAAKARAAWNYRVSAAGAEQATVTYWMNTIQHLKTKTPVLVTLNQSEAIRSEKVFERLSYAHPIFDAPALAAQGRFSEINGQRQTYYCGAYWRYGFHEDGCASALRALNALGWDW